jgi:hypothetical protein
MPHDARVGVEHGDFHVGRLGKDEGGRRFVPTTCNLHPLGELHVYPQRHCTEVQN